MNEREIEEKKLCKILERSNEKMYNLFEGNYYYDNSKTYIGLHGDSERIKVIGVRLGYSIPLYYRWYQNSVAQKDINGNNLTLKILLNHGDIYIPSEKAVGTDWLKKKIWTIRHAAGCEKYIK